MRNKYPGPCYRCGATVTAGAGHFERLGKAWRVQHAECAIQSRGQPDAARDEHRARKLAVAAAGTGRPAQNARKALRRMEDAA